MRILIAFFCLFIAAVALGDEIEVSFPTALSVRTVEVRTEIAARIHAGRATLGDEPFIHPRPSKNQERPVLKPVVQWCETTCYCNKRCIGDPELGGYCSTGGSDNCANGQYCDTCRLNCIPANPC